MGPSSINAATMSVEEAADFVAVQAEIGSSRRGLTKAAMSNPALGALIGGGLGGGAGLLTSAFSDDEEKRKNWLTNALTGGLMGAGVGGAAGLGWDMSKTLRDGGDPVQKEINDRIAQIRKRQQDITSRQPVTDPIGDRIRENLPSINPAAVTPEDIDFLKARGYDTSQLNGITLGDTTSTAAEYVGRPGTLLASAGGGTALGHLYDRAARGSFDGKRVMGLTPEQIKAMPAGIGSDITKMQGELAAARGLGGEMTPLTVRQRLMSRLTGQAPAPSYQLPTGAAAPAPSRLQRFLGITPKAPLAAPTPLTTPQQWGAMKQPVMKSVPTGRKGKMVGGAVGTLLTPFISSMIDGGQPQQQFVPAPNR
jgi:hypothetical protein